MAGLGLAAGLPPKEAKGGENLAPQNPSQQADAVDQAPTVERFCRSRFPDPRHRGSEMSFKGTSR